MLARQPTKEMQLPRAEAQQPAKPLARAPIALPPPVVSPQDPSVRHPVFFTERLRRKPPSSVPAVSHPSPVAHGYVYQADRRQQSKL